MAAYKDTCSKQENGSKESTDLGLEGNTVLNDSQKADPTPETIDSMEPDDLRRKLLKMQERMAALEQENIRLKKISSEIEGLRETERLYRTIFETTGIPIAVIDEDMTISMANRQFFLKFGSKAKDFPRGGKWTDLAVFDNVNRMVEYHKRRRQNSDDTLSAYEISYSLKDGTRYIALINIIMIPGTGKSIASLIDITEQKKAQLELEMSEEKFRTLADSCPFAIMMHQGNRWIYANRAAKEIAGYSEEEFYAMKFWDLVHPDYQELIIQSGRKRQVGKKVPSSYEFIIITKQGEERWVSLSGNRIQYEEHPTALISVIDITKRKQAEEERRKLEDQLQQSQKLESVGRLAGGVAHDFNNMLGVILGHSEMALTGLKTGGDLKKNLDGIKNAADRSANLTRQLLAFARKQPVTLQTLNLNNTVNGMISMLRRLIGEEVYLDWQPGNNLWPVRMDPSQIDQILANLSINSRDAIEGQGTISIETGNVCLDESYAAGYSNFLPGDYVKVSISDDGCGMDKLTLSHIFEPFFTTKEVGTGTGLGLSTVYGIVKQNKGFIHAYSEPGQGTTLTIYLPRYKGSRDDPARISLEKTESAGHETILIVEDEPDILEVTGMILEMKGYTVLAAGTPGDALTMAEKHEGDIHMILTDVVMPEINGRALADRLAKIHPGIKKLFMSGYTANVIANKGVLDEGIHFIQKPFSTKNLADKIRELLDGE